MCVVRPSRQIDPGINFNPWLICQEIILFICSIDPPSTLIVGQQSLSLPTMHGPNSSVNNSIIGASLIRCVDDGSLHAVHWPPRKVHETLVPFMMPGMLMPGLGSTILQRDKRDSDSKEGQPDILKSTRLAVYDFSIPPPTRWHSKFGSLAVIAVTKTSELAASEIKRKVYRSTVEKLRFL